MTGNQEHKRKGVTLKSLAAELRCLREVEVPQILKAKLLAAIPGGEAKIIRGYEVKEHWRVRNFGAAVAAVMLIFALMLVVNYSLSVPSQTFTELEDTSLCYKIWNQSSFLFDQNNTYVDKSLLYNIKWPVVNQNEPAY